MISNQILQNTIDGLAGDYEDRPVRDWTWRDKTLAARQMHERGGVWWCRRRPLLHHRQTVR